MTRNVATVRLYAAGTGFKKRQIAEDLSASERIVRSYLTEVDKQLHKEHEQQIFELYMDCWTQQEIAEQIGMAQKSVSRIIKISVKMEALPISVKVSISIEIQTLLFHCVIFGPLISLTTKSNTLGILSNRS